MVLAPTFLKLAPRSCRRTFPIKAFLGLLKPGWRSVLVKWQARKGKDASITYPGSNFYAKGSLTAAEGGLHTRILYRIRGHRGHAYHFHRTHGNRPCKETCQKRPGAGWWGTG